MKMNTSWAFASSAVVAILIAGCTTEVTDNAEGGTTTGTAGTSGTAGSAGSTGTSGSSGSGGSSDTDSGTEPMSACETCAYAKCKTEADKCEADTAGCGAEVDKFYVCISASGADETACSLTFVEQSNNSDAGGSLANDLAGCMVDTTGCLESCQGGGSDAGKD